MKNLLLVLTLAFAFNIVPTISFADELPEIAPVDEPAIPPVEMAAPED